MIDHLRLEGTMRSTWFHAAILLAVLPTAAAAQQPGPRRLSLTPAVGVFAGGSRTAPMAAVRFGYEATGRLRLVAEVGGARVNAGEAGFTSPEGQTLVRYREDWLLSTGGAELSVVTGRRARAVVGVQAGAAWQRAVVADVTSTVSPPLLDARGLGWSAVATIVPEVAAEIGLSSRLALRLTAQDYVLGGARPDHRALALGLTLR